MSERSRILIVDDEEINLEATSFLLEDAGFEVAVALNAEEALAELARRPADVLLTDIWLGGTNGLELAEKVRGLYPATAVVLISASHASEIDAEALRKADGFVVKPVDFDKLIEQLRALVARQRSRHESS